MSLLPIGQKLVRAYREFESIFSAVQVLNIEIVHSTQGKHNIPQGLVD